jgi:glyoxylase-like metal-dependent hydrolase (beta-lactamase superfamily II)
MKRALIGVGVVVLLLAAGAGAVVYSAFAHNRPIEDGSEPAPGVRTIKDGFVSVFVLDAGGGKVALIDAGNDKSGKAVLAELTRRGLTPAAVAGIFLTHGHPDHTAACRVLPDATVYAMANEVDVIGDACKLGHPLKDGEVVTINDLKVEAFATPGHTPGSAVYLSRGVLFFGDSAGGSKDGTVMEAVHFFSKDSALNIASLKSLEARLEPRASEVTTLAFAHSGYLPGFAPLKAFAASH